MIKTLLSASLVTILSTEIAPSASKFAYDDLTILGNDGITIEQLKELARQGVLKPQYVIPLQLERHPIIVFLVERGLFDLLSYENRLMLPVDRELAARMKISRYAEVPIDSYLDGIREQLDKAWATARAGGADAGNQQAVKSAAKQVKDLQYLFKAGLIEGMLYVAD